MEFKVLSSGDLYAHERRFAETEFYWLCSNCAARYDMYLDRAGRVSMRRRNAIRQGWPEYAGTLRLVTRSTRSMPRLQTTPSGERATSFDERSDTYYSGSRFQATIHH